MKVCLHNSYRYQDGRISLMDVLSLDELKGSVSENTLGAEPFLQFQNVYIFPGFVDVHVHFREPGFSYKETVRTGSLSAAHGGYTGVCTMPNLDPVPDSPEHLAPQLEAIRRDALIDVRPLGAITKGERGEALADMEALAPLVAGFSDDGRGVQSAEMMEAAMRKAKSLGKIIVAHCEDELLRDGGYIHDGEYARAHGHRGICSESEWKPIARDLELVRKTGCAYHVCHVSTKESVALIRKAKAEGLDVTCETAPHYLLLDETHLQEHGRFKMNPPLRSPADREAMIEGLLDGTVDMIATDHAPHTSEEKSRGLAGSAMGVVGLETAFPALYTDLVRTGILPLEKLIACLSDNPRRRFGFPLGRDFSVWDLSIAEKVDPNTFLSMGRSTPFEGMELFGKNLLTAKDGRIVYYAHSHA
ncbi:MAG: dihydroorotase [Clostridia bacterium]|nr:dihydroorotase [Clostridia bacterium]